MRVDDIRDPVLREWVIEYTMSQIDGRKAAKASSDDLRAQWRRYVEDDWRALKNLLELRPRAEARFDRATIQRAILDRIDSLPPIERNGHRYRQPYSVGLEVAALRALLGERDGPIVETVDFHS